MEKLINLVRQFDTGDIALPLMQREYVWRPRKVESLLDSLYKGYPVGSFYLWRPSKRQPTKRALPGEPVRYLLDGQQRLASLSMAINEECNETLLKPPGRRQSQAVSWRGFFDVVNHEFFLKGRKKSIERRIHLNDPALVALSDLIVMDDRGGQQLESNIVQTIRGLVEWAYIKDTDGEKNRVSAALRRVADMLDVDVLCHEIKTSEFAHTDAGEVEAAIEIFSRLNSGGVNLSRGDIEAAKLAQETTRSILGPMRDFAKDRVCADLGLNFVFLTRALVAIRRGSARLKLPKKWATVSPPIERSWEETRKGLQAATQLVRRLGWTSRRWLPSANALIPVARFAALKGGRISSHDEPEIARFLCLAAWSGAFSGASETAIDRYLRRLRKAGPGCSASVLSDVIPMRRRSKVQPEDIL